MIDILIPTNKPHHKIKRYVEGIQKTVSVDYRITPTCFQVSAAVNRNYALIQAKSKYVIMIDDDLAGFFSGWADKLLTPLLNSNVIMVSARLMQTKTKPGAMMDIPVDMSKSIVESPHGMLPSACVAFRNDGTRFDENYIGAGFEDTDFCMQLNHKYYNGMFMIHNEVKLIHKNEMKNQRGGQLQRNQAYYMKKWGLNVKK